MAASTDLTVVCYVRAPLLLDPVDSKVRTLRRCEAAGDVGELVTRSWPDTVALDGEEPHREVVERFEEFDRWANAHDVSVRPPFGVRESTSLVSEESRRVLVTPLLCLALYDDSRLLGVFPHSDGDRTHTATDAVAALRSGEMPPLPQTVQVPSDTDAGDDVPDAAGDPEACPHCERGLVNVQGLLSCPDCGWSDAALSRLDSASAKLVYLSLVDGPVSVESLETALDLDKLTIYGLVQSLSERGLIEETEEGVYRARRRDRTEEARLAN